MNDLVRDDASGVSLRHDLLRIAAVALAYFLAHKLAFGFPDAQRVLAAVWPAGGIGLAALLLSRRRLWPALLLAMFVAGVSASLMSGRPPLASSGFMFANDAESFFCAWMIQWLCGREVRFTRVREILTLAAAATVVNAATAVLGAGTAALANHSAFGNFWLTWWVADGLGILLVTPLIVTWYGLRQSLTKLRWQRIFELALFLTALGSAGYLCFLPGQHLLSLHPYMLVVLLVWPALRFGQRGVTAAMIALAAITVMSRAVNLGPILWGAGEPSDRLLSVQIFLGLVGITAMVLAASYAEARAAEQASHEEKARLHALADHLPNGMVYQVAINQDGSRQFQYVSAGIERLNGISAEEALRDPSALYNMVLEEDRPILAAAEELAERELSTFDVEVRMVRKDGAVRWMHLTSSPRRLPDGRILWDGMQTDVTEAKRAEQQRNLLHQQLQEARRLESIGVLAGGIAHEFNNLLTVINGYAGILRRNFSGDNTVSKELEAIHEAGARAAALTQQLLAYGRGRMLKPEPVDLNAIIGDEFRNWQGLLGPRIRVKTELATSLRIVTADPGQIAETIFHLLRNANDAMPEGGDLIVETANVEVDADFAAAHLGARPGQFVMLAVTDTGMGMDEATQARAFEPFFTTKSRAIAPGLGLATVYGIVAQHQGWISLESQAGKGSTFRIYLPS
jgi:PAS domain S-box-containing protein